MFSRNIRIILFRRYNSKISYESTSNDGSLSQRCAKVHGKFKCCKHKVGMWLKEQSSQVVKACTKQIEFILAQRVRRSIQIFQLYTRMWDEVALRELIRVWKQKLVKNTKELYVSAVGVTIFNWEQERITDKEMYSYSQEIEGIHKLRESTVVCSECNLRLVIDVIQPGIKYCQCQKKKRAAHKARQEGIEWEPFIERQDMIIWRREEKDFGGLYTYKVYATFDDVSAKDFLQVQIDINYRKQWDVTAKQLEIIDKDPLCEKSMESCSDIIYWEMVWPRMFANRDYVYQRRWLYDKETGMIIIISKGTEHPNAPNRPDTYRVQTYWSYIVIKPLKSFHEPGIEFGLTYFDDPGVNIPSAVSSWVAASGLPDYLCRMRQASKDYKTYKDLQETEGAILKPTIMLHSDDKTSDVCELQASKTIKDSKINSKDVNPIQDLEEKELLNLKSKEDTPVDNDEIVNQEENSDSDSSQNDCEEKGFYTYFFLSKLFT